VKLPRNILGAGLLAGCLSLGGCASLVQNVIADLAAESSCRSQDTGYDGRPAYDQACLDSIDQWQEENPM
jgi:hypothetical protein